MKVSTTVLLVALLFALGSATSSPTAGRSEESTTTLAGAVPAVPAEDAGHVRESGLDLVDEERGSVDEDAEAAETAEADDGSIVSIQLHESLGDLTMLTRTYNLVGDLLTLLRCSEAGLSISSCRQAISTSVSTAVSEFHYRRHEILADSILATRSLLDLLVAKRDENDRRWLCRRIPSNVLRGLYLGASAILEPALADDGLLGRAFARVRDALLRVADMVEPMEEAAADATDSGEAASASGGATTSTVALTYRQSLARQLVGLRAWLAMLLRRTPDSANDAVALASVGLEQLWDAVEAAFANMIVAIRRHRQNVASACDVSLGDGIRVYLMSAVAPAPRSHDE